VSQPQLALQVLGAPGLTSAYGPVPLSPSAVMLCAYLALSPRRCRPRATAAAHLFADAPDGAARRRLNTAVWRLRTEVRAGTGVELVEGDGVTVALRPAADLVVDAEQFECRVAPLLAIGATALSDDQAAALAEGLSLYRGKLVDACRDDWVVSARYRLENLYLTTLDLLVQYHGAHGDVARVTEYGDLALAEEPLREDLHRHLMAAYACAGRSDLVERQFERCRAALVAELGADPMPETIALYARLTRGGDCGEDGGGSPTVAALVAELERARRDIARLTATVERALHALRRLR
jgi:DNA-binding SARP family transcriptional activator